MNYNFCLEGCHCCHGAYPKKFVSICV